MAGRQTTRTRAALGGCALAIASWLTLGCGAPTEVTTARVAAASPPKPTEAPVAAKSADPASPIAAASQSEVTVETEAPEAIVPVNASLLDDCREPRSIIVNKAARTMELVCGEAIAARFPVSLGFAPSGHKHHEGDGRTPEGRYYITRKFVSRFHRSLELSYPNSVDAARGLADGQISQAQHDLIARKIRYCKRPPQNTPLGSLLQVHGGGGGTDVGDWTLGCVATNNESIEAVFAFHKSGCDAKGEPFTPVIVKP